jgi:hypothetical protein
MVQSLAAKVQVSSTTKVSRHAFTFLAFEPITSTTKISSAKTALKATAEMQPSADICQYPGSLAEQPIVATDSSQYNSSADVGLRTARRNSNKMFQLIVRYVFTVRFKQQYQSKMQQYLVDFSSSKTISNAKLANNDFQLIVVLTLIPNREGLCAVPITSYSPSEGERNFSVFEGAQTLLQPFLDTTLLCQIPSELNPPMLGAVIPKYPFTSAKIAEYFVRE